MQNAKELKLAEDFKSVLFSKTSKMEVSEVLEIWRDFVKYTVNYHKGIVDYNDESPLWGVHGRIIDINEFLYKAGAYQDLIDVNEDILKLEWKNPDGTDDSIMVANAKRVIADTYAMMGDYKKAITLYESYLEEDNLWGEGWLGYCWILEEYDREKLKQVVEDLKSRILEDEFYDKDELQEWLNNIV